MIKKLCVVFAVIFALNVQAQEGVISPYSFFGIGTLKFKGTAENRAMGGISVYSDSIHVNLRNPASYGGENLKYYNEEQRPVIFTVGGSHSDVTLKTDDSKDNGGATTFDYLAISIPIGKLGFGFGVMPFTRVGYKLEAEGMVADTMLVTNRYRGEGGVNRAFLSFGYQVAKDFRLGVDANYNFGNIRNSSIEFVYDDDGFPVQYQSRESNRSDLRGIKFNIGAIYSPMITDKLQLTSTFTYSPKANLNSDNQRAFETIVINEFSGQEVVVNDIIADLASEGLEKTTLTLPARTSVGLGIGKPRVWFLGAEYTFVKTSDYSNNVFSIENQSFEDASTFALGGFIIPQYRSLTNYWRRVVYRAGMRYENTGIKINNESINEFGISFGVGLPLGGAFSNVNMGLEVGKRGTTKQNLVQENFVNFHLSISLNDRWFQKTKIN